MRYIMYIHYFGGSFDVKQVATLAQCRQLLRNARVNSGQSDVSASLYPWTEDNWAEAQEYADLGCPFDYPQYVLTVGPRFGIITERA